MRPGQIPKRRYKLPPKASGFLCAASLWEGVTKQVKPGWPAPPLPIDLEGSVAAYEQGSVDVAYRFGVGRAGKLRARGALERKEANLYCSA